MLSNPQDQRYARRKVDPKASVAPRTKAGQHAKNQAFKQFGAPNSLQLFQHTNPLFELLGPKGRQAFGLPRPPARPALAELEVCPESVRWTCVTFLVVPWGINDGLPGPRSRPSSRCR